jgi:hypothetical protein
MEVVGLLVGVLGVLLGELRARKAQRELRRRLGSIEDKTTRVMATVLGENLPQEGWPEWTGSFERATGEKILDPDHDLPAAVGYADANNDGRPELLVQHPIGAHSSMLKVYGWRGDFPVGDFEQLGELHSSCPTSFQVEDVDGDDRLEITAIDVDHEAMPEDRAYANAERVRVVYRWDGSQFTKINEGSTWDPMVEQDPPEDFIRVFGPPRWAHEPAVRGREPL